jgi:FkbM family methyltransferase
MKEKLKKLFYIILRFYIPDCIKGHTFFLKKIDDNSLIIDLGSNQGEFQTIFLSKKKNIYFSSIEFDEKFKKKENLQNNFSLRRVLSGHDGLESIYLAQNKTNPEYFGKVWSIIEDKDWEIIKKKEEKSISLKSFLNMAKKNFNKRNISLIKLDVEGAEIKAINSLSDEDFEGIDQITLEFHDFMFKSLKQETEDLIALLKTKSFYFFDFSLNEKRRDVLFIKKNKLNFFEKNLCNLFTSTKIKKFLKNKNNFFRGYFLLFYRNYIQ